MTRHRVDEWRVARLDRLARFGPLVGQPEIDIYKYDRRNAQGEALSLSPAPCGPIFPRAPIRPRGSGCQSGGLRRKTSWLQLSTGPVLLTVADRVIWPYERCSLSGDPPSDKLHGLELNCGTRYAVVRIRLFASLGALTYFAVAGTAKAGVNQHGANISYERALLRLIQFATNCKVSLKSDYPPILQQIAR